MKREFWFLWMLMSAPIPGMAQVCSAGASTLVDSGPLVISQAGQLVENLRITSTNGDAIQINAPDVIIRNVEIFHEGGYGIKINSGSDRVRIEDVSITHTGAPQTGANASQQRMNIFVNKSANVQITRVRLLRGSSGIYLYESPDSHITWIEGHDFRGPFPRGQLVQWHYSDNGLLEDFSVINPLDTSFPEDAINSYRSKNTTIRRGLVKGLNATHGAAVQFENYEEGGTGLVEDVDAVDVTNGFAAYNTLNRDITFRRVRVKNVLCAGAGGRQPPSSGGLYYVADDNMAAGSGPMEVWDSQHYPGPCHDLVWYRDSFDVFQSRLEDFVPRPPVENNFCWENATADAAPKPPSDLRAQ